MLTAHSDSCGFTLYGPDAACTCGVEQDAQTNAKIVDGVKAHVKEACRATMLEAAELVRPYSANARTLLLEKAAEL